MLDEVTEEERPSFRKLQEILLSFGGSETCFPDIEEDIEKILVRGAALAGRPF